MEQPRLANWRCLPFSDARLRRGNFLYALPPESLTPSATVVAGELKMAVRDLIQDPAWRGFECVVETKPHEGDKRFDETLA